MSKESYGLTFYEYSQRFLDKHSPTGDLARDIRDDTTFPELACTHERIKSYLVYSNACEGAMKAFETMWKSYKAYMRRLGYGK